MLRGPMIAPVHSSLRHHFPALRRGLRLSALPLPVLPPADPRAREADPVLRPSHPTLLRHSR
jgi:hypothetical protein